MYKNVKVDVLYITSGSHQYLKVLFEREIIPRNQVMLIVKPNFKNRSISWKYSRIPKIEK